MGKIMLIYGSSRRDGDTGAAVSLLDPKSQMKFVNLSELDISAYDYENKNQEDDFIPIIEEMQGCDTIVFATPIYWWVMSGQMKVFLDRFKDCTSIRKDLGRGLAGKKVYVLAVYNNTYGEEFESLFAKFSKYMDMEYKETFFYYSGDDEDKKEGNHKIEAFGEEILNG